MFDGPLMVDFMEYGPTDRLEPYTADAIFDCFSDVNIHPINFSYVRLYSILCHFICFFWHQE